MDTMTDNQYKLMTDEEMKLFTAWDESGSYPDSKFADAVIDSYFERAETATTTAERIALVNDLAADMKMIGFMFGYKYAMDIVKEGDGDEDS